MSTRLKKGFTLIELMVVVVIIGILAAIAIPKLFGMTAKAKAQEVGTTTGTWVKLQQAFVAEHSKVGSNARIGFTSPGDPTGSNGQYAAVSTTAYFEYRNSLAGEDPDPTSAVGKGETSMNTAATLTATLQGDLQGDCVDGSKWTSTVTAADNLAASTVPTTTKKDCAKLTPNFDKIK